MHSGLVVEEVAAARAARSRRCGRVILVGIGGKLPARGPPPHAMFSQSLPASNNASRRWSFTPGFNRRTALHCCDRARTGTWSTRYAQRSRGAAGITGPEDVAGGHKRIQSHIDERTGRIRRARVLARWQRQVESAAVRRLAKRRGARITRRQSPHWPLAGGAGVGGGGAAWAAGVGQLAMLAVPATQSTPLSCARTRDATLCHWLTW